MWRCTAHSRLVEVRRVKRLRVSSHVGVEHVAVVQGEGLPRLLVLGEVPARSQFGLQSLRAEDRTGPSQAGTKGTKLGRDSWGETHPNLPQQVADDVQSRDPGRGRQRRVAAEAVG